MHSTPFEQGTFFIGCNYWASHAGMFMWRDWDAKVVESDFERLARARVNTLRVFPLWPDFQPLRMHYTGGGAPKEIRMGEEPLPDTEAGQAGVDEVMLGRFREFCDLAEKHGLRLIVGLLTGWMSGRWFVPEMLQEKNVLTDPLALKWEIKFVRLMVRRFRSHPAILAWDLGNECNCLGPLNTSEEAYAWTAAISMTIRVEDPEHRIVSGMHSLLPDGVWRMQDQGELTDVLCTHPYPLFTPHCDTDPMNRMKSALHAAAESTMYASIGGRPCFAEETGVLGPMMISDEYAADYLRAMMLTLLAHDLRGMMWWCANEQSALTRTPYDWHAVERELGLFRLDGSKKPVLTELTRFSEFVDSLPFDRLPPAAEDAVCLLTHGQDVWAAAYGAFILAKQSGLTLRFAWVEDASLPEAPVYLVPSLEGTASLTRRMQCALTERVRAGAKLYLSMNGPLLSPFAELTGVRVLTRMHRPSAPKVTLDGETFPLFSDYLLELEALDAEVLARGDHGEILFTRRALDKGTVYALFAPIEKTMATVPGAVDSEDALPCWRFYRAMNLRNPRRVAEIDLPTVGLTEHVADDGARILVAVNYEPFPQTARLTLKDGWRAEICASPDNTASLAGHALTLGRNSGAVISVKKA